MDLSGCYLRADGDLGNDKRKCKNGNGSKDEVHKKREVQRRFLHENSCQPFCGVI